MEPVYYYVYIGLTILSMLSITFVMTRLWRFRNVKGGTALQYLAAGLFIWSLGYVFEANSSTLTVQNINSNISSIGVLLVPPSWLIFTINYTAGESSITGWKVFPFAIFPMIAIAIMWHPDLRQLLWKTETLLEFPPYYFVDRTYGPFYWIVTLYSYGLIIWGIVTLFWKLQISRIYQRQITLIVLAVVIPVIGGIIYLFDLFPIHKDMTPVFFSFSMIIFSFALFRYNLFKVIPLANRQIIQQMQDSVLVFDLENHLIEANQKARSFLGIKTEDIGKCFEDIVPLFSHLDDILASDFAKQEKTIALQDHQYTLEVQSIKLINNKGLYQGNVILLHDVTEARRAQAALSESEERFRMMVNSMNETVFTLDTQMRYSGLYGSEVENLVLDQNSIIGKTTWELFGEGVREVNETNIRKALNGESVVFDWNAETFGTIGYYQTMLYPMKNQNGEVISVFGIGRDITEKRRAEEVLHTSNAALQSMHDGVIITDNNWMVKQWNRVSENLFCITEEQAVDTFIGDCINMIEEYPGQIKEKIETLIREKADRGRHQFRTPKGIIWTDVNSQTIEVNGVQIGWIFMFEDITRQKQMQDQLLAQDRLASIGQLTAGIAHEINNPLAIIKGIVDLTLDSDISEETKSDMTIVNGEIDRASGIIQNLLTFSHNQSSEKTNIDINSLITSVLSMRRYQQKQNNIQTTLDITPHIPEIWGSETQLHQVLINIIINAEYFITKENGEGKIKIITNQTGEYVQISISDNGPGIAADKIEHIFDPFFTTKAIGEGTGLGLSICYGIIHDHKGTITVDSRLGKGTTFTIMLPIYKPEKILPDNPE